MNETKRLIEVCERCTKTSREMQEKLIAGIEKANLKRQGRTGKPYHQQ